MDASRSTDETPRGSARDPGLSGVVPFRFACHRCGHCCSGGSGYVWLAEGELERMAEFVGANVASFSARHVRAARDPRSGEERLALREVANEGGRCTLLVGRNTCSVYDARPEHCRAFPYWPSVMRTRDGFEAARATCPGIAVEVGADVRARAFAALAEFYARLDATEEPATCCLSRDGGDPTFATALEVDYALAQNASSSSGCRFGDRRPLACRGAHDHESRLRELRTIERSVGYPAAYSSLASMVATRTSDAENPA